MTAEKRAKQKAKFMFQYHIQVGNYPHIKFYSVSPFQYLSNQGAKDAATKFLIKKGINPNKAKIHTNQRNHYFKTNMYSGFKGEAQNG